MKKIFTLLFACAALAANAKDYTDDLAVSSTMGSATSSTTVNITQAEDGTYSFTLPNLSMKVIVMTINVGTIVLDNIEGTDLGDGKTLLSTTQDVEIQAGDDEEKTWIGPNLGSVPVTLAAVVGEDKAYAELSLTVEYNSMTIDAAAVFGSRFSDEYNGTLVATFAGVPITDTAMVTVYTQIDGSYTFQLKDFSISLLGDVMYVGTINIEDIEGTLQDDGTVELATDQSITIEAGDEETIEWAGPYLGDVPVTLTGTMGNGSIDVALDIVTQSFGTIEVTFTGTAATTGIGSVAAAEKVSVVGAYTLTGAKAPAGYKGIVIENGKKVLK